MLKKEYAKKLIIWSIVVAFLAAIFFITRLINLTIIPIFTDEAIYLRWAQIALSDPTWRFISLIDGKQPLLIWLLLPVFKLIQGDPLVLGRLVSIVCGFVGMLGLSTFCWYKTRKISSFVLGGLVYIVVPFFLMYDRLAIYEALFVALAVWTLFLSYLFGKHQRLDISLLLGSAIGAGLLTKSYANYYLILLPVTLLLVQWKKSQWFEQLLRWFGLAAVVVIQSQIYNSILRLSEFRHYIGEKNLQFIYGFSDFFADPFHNALGNFRGLSSWLVGYLTLPLFILIIAAFIWYIRNRRREALFFLAYFFVPFVSLAFFGKVIYPRFVLFMTLPLLVPTVVFVSTLLQQLKNTRLIVVGIVLILSYAFYFDIKILIDPIHAPLPYGDRQQFINDWPAGFGIPEVVTYISTAAENNHVVVGTEGTFGLFPMALELYLGKNENVTFKAYWPLSEVPEELLLDAQSQPTFLVFKERQDIPKDWPLELVGEYQRGDGPTYLRFYRVLPKT